MARVFISYRRADGQYAVGWIEERLRQIYQDASVSTAFRDSDLRLGENFPARLAQEVHECDVLIAVIGRLWRGDDGDEPARILDPADWVGREITSAIEDDSKLVIPVLLSGVEPVRASDLSPTHRAFADLHALRFDVREDLDVLIEQVGEHLTAIDTARNHLSGLDKPLPNTSWRPSPAVLLTAVMAAVAGALISWLLKDVSNSTDAANDAWRRFSAVQFAYLSGAFVIGRAYLRGPLADVFAVNWKTIARLVGIALALIAVFITSYAPGESDHTVLTFLDTTAGALLVSPWILAFIGAGLAKVNETAIRPRAILLAKQRSALGAATAVLSVTLGLVVCTNAALLEPNPGMSTAITVVGFGVLLSIVLVGGVEYSHSRMRSDSALLRLDITEIGDVARKHVEPVLISGRDDLRPRIALLTILPLIVTIIAAILVVNLPGTEVPLIGEVVR